MSANKTDKDTYLKKVKNKLLNANFEEKAKILNNLIKKLPSELYDLETEEMLAYSNGIATTYNREFYEYLIENNYQVCLTKVGDYIEGHIAKDYYSLDEIRKLEPQIEESLKIINKAKVKAK